MERRTMHMMAARWRSYWLRRRMHRFARLIIEAREVRPDLLRYLEGLEARLEAQERELKQLRWAVTGEQLADWDREQDQWDWFLKGGSVKD